MAKGFQKVDEPPPAVRSACAGAFLAPRIFPFSIPTEMKRNAIILAKVWSFKHLKLVNHGRSLAYSSRSVSGTRRSSVSSRKSGGLLPFLLFFSSFSDAFYFPSSHPIFSVLLSYFSFQTEQRNSWVGVDRRRHFQYSYGQKKVRLTCGDEQTEGGPTLAAYMPKNPCHFIISIHGNVVASPRLIHDDGDELSSARARRS